MKSRPKWFLRRKRQARSSTASDHALADALAVTGVLTAEQLERAFQRERARVERNHQCFSLAVFRLPEAKTLGTMREAMESAAQILLNRIRTYDDVGMVDTGSLAVLLPETSGGSTWVFADGALEDLRKHGMTARCEVYTYPHPDSQERPATSHQAKDEDSSESSFEDYDRVDRPDQSSEEGPQRTSCQGDPTSLPAAEKSLLDVLSSTFALERPVLRALKRPSHEDDQPAGLESSQHQAGLGRAVRPRMLRYRTVGMSAGSSALAAVMLPRPIPAEELARWHRTSPSAEPSAGPPAGTLAETRPIHDLAPYFEEQLPLHRRTLDIVASGMALVLVSPVLLTATFLVKVTSTGPTIFAQTRAGRGGRPFQFYKLRSMYRDAEDRKNALRLVNEQDGPIFKIKNDPRITPVGRILRKFSIDELPQLFNVLKGDMTLVGPRPPVMEEVKEYETWQRQRLDITGGITCIWQVRMDVRYRKQRSISLDLKLVWKTFGAVFSGKGAY